MAAAAGVLQQIHQSAGVPVGPNSPLIGCVDCPSTTPPNRNTPKMANGVSNLRDGVGATGNDLVAALALPDTNSLALDGVLAAEGADVAGVLGDFHLLHLLTQGGTVSVGNWSIFGSSSCGRFSFEIIEDHGRSRAISRAGR